MGKMGVVGGMGLFCVIAGGLLLKACGRPVSAPANPALPPMTEAHKAALAHAARGIGLARKDSVVGIDEIKLAIQTEPDNREWKGMLAFHLHHYAKKTDEAIPIWRELAKGSDKEADMARKWLRKVRASE